MGEYTAPLQPWPIRHRTYNMTAAELVALNAATGTITTPIVIPARAVVVKASIRNAGTAGATLTTLTATVGYSGDASAFIGAQTVLAANAGIDRIPESQQAANQTAATNVTVFFTGNATIAGLTSLTDGVTVTIDYIEG